MEEKDVPAVYILYTRYMQRFDMTPAMSMDEVRHHLLGAKGMGERKASLTENGQVIWTYVVEVTMALDNPVSVTKLTRLWLLCSIPTHI